VIVADSNLIAYLLIRGDQTPNAQAVLRKDPVWCAPILWRNEFRNVLAIYLRQQHISVEDALSYMREAEDLLSGNEYQVQSPPVLELVARSGCTAYDCEFVHLAEELRVPLVTADRQVLRAFPTIAVSLQSFVAELRA
jgi:predicted nucleic acid-binding protein